MRAYNQDPTHKEKLRFFGIDITDPRLGLTNVLAYLNEVDPEYATSLTEEPDALALFSADIWSETLENYKRLSERDLDTLTKRFTGLLIRFEDRRLEYVSRSSRVRYDWLLRQAFVAAKANEMFTAGVTGTFVEAGNVRERAMADNIRWILKEVGRGERLIVWAHNFHVARGPADLDVPGRPPARGMMSMIAYLNEELGDEMLSVGFSFNRGDYPEGPLPAAGRDTVDGVLARVGFPVFIADLRKAPGRWVKEKVSMRGQGGRAQLVPGDAFDVVFFADVVTKTVPTAGARRRFDSLRR
jgi:erythromycin esterase